MAGMDLRIAAAVALVGWYLMMPPPGSETGPDVSRPFGDWIIDSVYTTAPACKHGLKQLRARLPGYLHAHANTKAFLDWAPKAAKLARCVAADDPRLNEIEN